MRSYKQGGKMDILLGIPDGDLTRDSFPAIKSFAQQFSNGFKLGPNDVRMGVFSYSDTAKTVVQVRDGTSSTSINRAIQNLAHGGGGNRKDRAIEKASQMFGLSPRSGVKKNVVLLSHGASSSGSADLSTIKESFPDMDIYPVAIGGAARTDAAKLSKDYTRYDGFSDLTSSGAFDITETIIQGGSSVTTNGGTGGGGTSTSTTSGNFLLFKSMYTTQQKSA
jgi:hypothetical protein